MGRGWALITHELSVLNCAWKTPQRSSSPTAPPRTAKSPTAPCPMPSLGLEISLFALKIAIND